MKKNSTYRQIGFLPCGEIKKIQQKLLREHLVYCKEQSPFYQKYFKKHRIDPRTITMDDLGSLPCTGKADIEGHNDEFLAVEPEKIIDIVLSSGTTGKPTKIAYTESDLQRLAYNEEKSFCACGFTPKDIVLLTCTMDRCFVAGLAYYLGIRAVGATAIRNGLNSMESHAEVIRRTRPTALVGVPSFLRKLGIFLAESRQKHAVKKLVCIGEPLRDAALAFLKVGKDLEDIWDARAYSTYSSSEIVTTFCECTAQAGGHLHPDLAIVEIVGDTDKKLTAGEIGEVVVTPMSIEGMPLVRFKTGDISFIIDGPCACGRNSVRLGPILGRKKQMMKVRGTTLYPQALYSALEEIPGVKEYYIIAESEDALSDTIEIHVAASRTAGARERLQKELQARLRVTPRIIIEDEKKIKERVFNQASRKPVRFFDRRRS